MTIWTPAHSWSNSSTAGNLSFKTKEEIELLLQGFDIKKMKLDEGHRKESTNEDVFWSAYEIIAVKKDPKNI